MSKIIGLLVISVLLGAVAYLFFTSPKQEKTPVNTASKKELQSQEKTKEKVEEKIELEKQGELETEKSETEKKSKRKENTNTNTKIKKSTETLDIEKDIKDLEDLEKELGNI